VVYEVFAVFFLSLIVIALAILFEEMTLRFGLWEGFLQRLLLMVPLAAMVVLMILFLWMAAMSLAGREPFLAFLSAIGFSAPLSAAVFMAGRLLDAFGAEAWPMIGGSAVLGIVFLVATVCLIDRDLCRDPYS